MHTVVFGWFGGSAVWFLPLLWRLVKSVLPGGVGLRGPGTIRLWLGFVCVLIASCTLEASLIGMDGVNGFGHALAAGPGRLLGHIGTPLAALALFVVSLPWLVDFRWRDVVEWADGAFGLGLSRGLAKRDEEARRHRSVDEAAPSHASPATNTMAPKTTRGRYARPTIWRPPASGRNAAGTAAAAGAASGKDAAARGAGSGSGGWRAGADTARVPAKQIEPVLRTGAMAPLRQDSSMQTQMPAHAAAQAPMPTQTQTQTQTQSQKQPQGQPQTQTQAQSQAHALNTGKAGSPFVPAEPVAPAGWLRTADGRTAAAAGAPGAPSGASAAVARDAALQVGRRASGEQRPIGSSAALAATAAAASGVSARAAQAMAVRSAPGGGMAGESIHASTRGSRAASLQRAADAAGSFNRTTTSRQPLSNAAHAGGVTPPSGTRRPAPGFAHSATNSQNVAEPASVEETLRSIAENTARWTDMAGVSLARSRGVDGVKPGDVAQAAMPVEAPRPASEAPGSDPVQAVSAGSVAQASAEPVVGRAPAVTPAEPSVETAPVALPAAAAVAEETAIAASDAPVEDSNAPVAQWPTEPPVIHVPGAVASQVMETAESVADANTTETPAAVQNASATSGEAVHASAVSAAALVESAAVQAAPVVAMSAAAVRAESAPRESAPIETPPLSSAPQYPASIGGASTSFQRFAAQLEGNASQEDAAPVANDATHSATRDSSHTAPADATIKPVSGPSAESLAAAQTVVAAASTVAPAPRKEEPAPTVDSATTATGAPTQPAAPAAEIVVDKTLVPWESKLGAVAAQRPVSPSGSSQPDASQSGAVASPGAVAQSSPATLSSPVASATMGTGAQASEPATSSSTTAARSPALPTATEPASTPPTPDVTHTATATAATATHAALPATPTPAQSVASNVVRFPGFGATAPSVGPSLGAHGSATGNTPATVPPIATTPAAAPATPVPSFGPTVPASSAVEPSTLTAPTPTPTPTPVTSSLAPIAPATPDALATALPTQVAGTTVPTATPAAPATATTPAAPGAFAANSPSTASGPTPAPASPIADTPPTANGANSADSAAAPAEAAAQRPPLRGHAPVNGFEFHAPAASMVELPPLDLLARADAGVEPISDEKLRETGQLIEQRLQEFKVPVTVVGASAGPVITRFEIEPALGVRGSQIVGLMKDLSRGLGLTSIRVVETIPGKTCMGLELPNAKRQTIRLSEILEASVYQNSHSQLTLAMGKDITGHPVVADLAKAPHMLVAGTTGSGKSVAINAMICSLLFKATPEEVRLIMIDPKMLELSVYEGIPHLLAPVVTDMKLAANALNWCVGEMEKRYRLMSAVGVRNLAGFNQKIRDTEAKGKKLGNPFSLTPDAPEPLAPLPLIVVVIDELADLMMVAGKKIEELIARLAQKARAAGIHLILATQRPSVDVITGLIKANIPTRVAFQVSSKIDSRTILDQMGAESLLGQGDMLFLPPGTGYPQRVHGAFVADEEVHAIVEYLKQFGEPQYEEGILDGPAADGGAAQDLFGETPDAEADPLYDEAVAFVVRTRRASISSVQRQLRIGYNRAARLVEQMETAGLVSAMSINGSREVLAPGPAE